MGDESRFPEDKLEFSKPFSKKCITKLTTDSGFLKNCALR
jgi:hypothetical protein